MRYALLALSLVAAPALAQVNRCDTPGGVVYQQAACPGAPVVKVAPLPPVTDSGKALCEAAAPASFKDPASVKFGTVTLARSLTTRERVAYIMFINAKNSYGGYVGEQPYFCFLDRAQTRVTRVSESAL